MEASTLSHVDAPQTPDQATTSAVPPYQADITVQGVLDSCLATEPFGSVHQVGRDPLDVRHRRVGGLLAQEARSVRGPADADHAVHTPTSS